MEFSTISWSAFRQKMCAVSTQVITLSSPNIVNGLYMEILKVKSHLPCIIQKKDFLRYIIPFIKYCIVVSLKLKVVNKS